MVITEYTRPAPDKFLGKKKKKEEKGKKEKKRSVHELLSLVEDLLAMDSGLQVQLRFRVYNQYC